MTQFGMTVGQAAKSLGLSVRAVQHRITNGKIVATKIGEGRTSAYLIPVEEVERVRKERAESLGVRP